MSIRKYKLKNRVSYQVTIQLSPTKQLSKKFARKVDAETWEGEQRRLAQTNTTGADASLTFGELVEIWRGADAYSHLETSSIKRYESYLRLHLMPRFGSTKVRDLTRPVVRDWRNRVLRDEAGLAAKTCDDCLGLFQKILNEAVADGRIMANPIKGMRRPPRQKAEFAFWTREEAIRFLEYVEGSEPALYPACALALNTGMRLGEMAGLRWDCVNLERRQLVVKRSWCQVTQALKENTKTKTSRVIPINADLAHVLVALRAQGQDGFVLPRFDFKNLVRKTKSLAEAAGVRPITAHQLRHSFASMWMMSGQSMFELQKVLGHHSIQMTERYSHLAPDHLAGKTDFLDLRVRKIAGVTSISSAP